MGDVEPSRWRLGDVLFDQADGTVWRDGRRCDLTPKLLDILNVLVEAAPRAVTKQQLLDAVWPEAIVGEAALAQRVKELRRVLGDDARQPRYIETVARRGYRLKAAVAKVEDGEAVPSAPESPAPTIDPASRPDGSLRVGWTAASLGILIVVLGWFLLEGRSQPSLPRVPPAAVVPSPFTPRRAVTVAVASREDSEAGAPWAGPVLSEMLTAELGAGGYLRTINPARLGEACRELGIEGLPTRAALPRLRQLLGADLAVVGRYRVEGTGADATVTVRVEVRDVLGGEVFGAVADSAPVFALSDLAGRLGGRLRTICGVQLPAAAAMSPQRQVFPAGPVAARHYGDGLAAMREFDFPRAIAGLERAVAAEGDAVAVRVALAQALEWSGQRERALVELGRCLGQAGTLPREHQLVIEADFRELSGAWERAVEINRSLHVLQPDNLDYGLSLATLLASHGEEVAATRVLDELRKLPAPLGSDPRIDLASAWMHESDLTAKLAAAGRAAERAGALGARMLLAAARIQQGRALRGLGKPAEALTAFQDAWRLREQAGDVGGVGKAVRHVALVEWDEGDLSAAQTHLETAVDLFRRIGDPEQLAETLRESARLAIDRGRTGEAAALLAEAAESGGGRRSGGEDALLALERARLALLTSSPAAAIAAARAALTACRADALVAAEARARALLSLALFAAADGAAAEAEIGAAEDLAAATDDRIARLEIATAAAVVASARGRCGAVRQRVERALVEGAAAPLRLRLEAQMALARCASGEGEPGSGERLAELNELARRTGFAPSYVGDRRRSAP